MISAEELQNQLSQHYCSENLYKHFLGFNYSDGVRDLAEQGECYWLLDAIGSYQPRLRKLPRLKDFQLWLLVVGDNHDFIKPKSGCAAVLTCWEDTPLLGVKPAVTQHIGYTDFPLPEIKLYMENNVLILPSER
jgi:hypothetical protein